MKKLSAYMFLNELVGQQQEEIFRTSFRTSSHLLQQQEQQQEQQQKRHEQQSQQQQQQWQQRQSFRDWAAEQAGSLLTCGAISESLAPPQPLA